MELGADLVVESLTKSMNGHSDVLLGMLAGGERVWQRVPQALSTWGWTAAPFDCWLAARGLETLALRAERASANARWPWPDFWRPDRPPSKSVHYPGLPNHPDHDLAARQFEGRFGSLVTFTLSGGADAAAGVYCRGRSHSVLSFVRRKLDHAQPSGQHQPPRAQPRSPAEPWESTTARSGLSVGIESSETIVEILAEALARCPLSERRSPGPAATRQDRSAAGCTHFGAKKSPAKLPPASELDSKEEKVMIDSIVLMLVLGRRQAAGGCSFEREFGIGQSRRAANRCSPFAGLAGWNRKSETVWGKKKKKKPSKLKAS